MFPCTNKTSHSSLLLHLREEEKAFPKLPKPKPLSMLKLFLLLSLVFLQISVLVSVNEGVYEMEMPVRKTCTGKMGLCFWDKEEMEMEMDSESNRRVLMVQKKYISYETLRRDVIPCARPGASYYNCHVMRPANPYSRGCEVITRCDRDRS